VGGTKVAVQPNFDPNKGQTSSTAKPAAKPAATSKTTTQSQARDAKGRFISTKKVAEALAKKLKSK
jgi:hypothetical protein